MEQSGGSKPIKSAIKRIGNAFKSIIPNQDEEDDDTPSNAAGGDLLSLKLSQSDVENMRNAKKARKEAKKETKQARKESRAENVQPKAAAPTAKAPAPAAPVAFRKISVPDRASPQQAENDNFVSRVKLTISSVNSHVNGAKINTPANALNLAMKPLKAMLNFGKKGPSPSAPKRAAAGPKMGR